MLGIIADDVTGACECAGIARSLGIAASVFMQWDQPPLGASAVRVMVTDSRHCSAEEAAQRVCQAAHQLQAVGCTTLYKKTDSALRGPIGAELGALLETYPDTLLWYLPAYPRMKRYVRDGRLFIEQTPVEETAFAHDPQSPVRSGYILEMLGPALAGHTCLSDPQDLRTRVSDHGAYSDKRIVVVNGSCDDDLAMAVAYGLGYSEHSAHAASQRKPPQPAQPMWAGPAGLLHFLLPALHLPPTEQSAQWPERWLYVIGSQHPQTRLQAEATIQAGAGHLALSPQDFSHYLTTQKQAAASTNRNDPPAHHQDFLPNDRLLLEQRHSVLTTLSEPFKPSDYCKAGEAAGVDALAVPAAVTQWQAQVAAALFAHNVPGLGLVVCGGATAQAVFERLAIQRLDVIQELAPGIIASIATTFPKKTKSINNRLDNGKTSESSSFCVITKNGAFGSNKALSKVIAHTLATHHSAKDIHSAGHVIETKSL